MIDNEKSFATRYYQLSSGESVEIVIDFPANDPDDWYCYYSIKWGTDQVSIKKSPGIDALDALLRSIKMIELQLRTKADLNGEIITWDGNQDIGLTL